MPWGVCSGLGEAAYFVTLARALEIGPLAAVYTVSRGSSMLLVWPISHVLLGEPFGWRAVTAIALLIAGLALLAPTDDRRSTTRAGYGWALACGVFIAAFQLVYKGAVAGGSGPPLIFVISMATSLPIVILSVGRQRVARLRDSLLGHPWFIAFGAATMTVSFLIVLYVLRSHGAGWVMTLRNCSVAFAQLFGWTLLRERPTARAVAGVALVLISIRCSLGSAWKEARSSVTRRKATPARPRRIEAPVALQGRRTVVVVATRFAANPSGSWLLAPVVANRSMAELSLAAILDGLAGRARWRGGSEVGSPSLSGPRPRTPSITRAPAWRAW